MSAEVAARAFDPFFTTKPIGQGTGLGLSMIYGFARQSNGHVTIDSRPGRERRSGSICRGTGATAPRDAATAQAAELAATGETVLVVEDEPVVRGVILEMLVEQGYRTLEAVDGPSGLDMLRGRATDRSADHRCRPARHQRPPARRPGARDAARPQGAVHHRLRRECRDIARLSAAGHGNDHQAVRPRPSRRSESAPWSRGNAHGCAVSAITSIGVTVTSPPATCRVFSV